MLNDRNFYGLDRWGLFLEIGWLNFELMDFLGHFLVIFGQVDNFFFEIFDDKVSRFESTLHLLLNFFYFGEVAIFLRIHSFLQSKKTRVGSAYPIVKTAIIAHHGGAKRVGVKVRIH